MDGNYVTKVEHEILKKDFIQLDKNTAVKIGKLEERATWTEKDMLEIKVETRDDIKEIRADNKSQKNMMIGIAATTILTLIGMVVTLLT